jgi:hypothetical protein
LQVGMARGVATVAQRDQIRWFIHAPSGTRNQMVNVRFPLGAELSTLLTTPVVASENDGPHLAPMPMGRIRPWRAHGRVS